VHLNLLLRLIVTKIAVLDTSICQISIHIRVLYVYEIGVIFSLISCSTTTTTTTTTTIIIIIRAIIIIIIIIIIILLSHITEFHVCACQPQV